MSAKNLTGSFRWSFVVNCVRGQILSETKTIEINMHEADHHYLDKLLK